MKEKKLKALIISCLVFVMAFFAVACGTPEVIDNNNIGNVIIGGERPNYDDIFDYNSGFSESVLSDINTLTLKSDKVTFVGGAKEASVTKLDPLPEIVNNNTGTDIAGWINANDTTSFWKQTSTRLRENDGDKEAFLMPAKNTTIAPFFVPAGQRPLIPASDSNKIDTNKDYGSRVKTDFYDTDIGMQVGAAFKYTGSAIAGGYPAVTSGSSNIGSIKNGYFRMLTSCAADKGESGALLEGVHTFYYRFKNLGDTTIKLKVYQGSSGTSVYAGGYSDEIVLEPGAEWSAQVSISLSIGANANAITFLAFGTDHSSNTAEFAMLMSKSPTNDIV